MNADLIARRWLGTPYQDGAALRGIGTDCAGLILGVGRELGLDLPARHDINGRLLAAAHAYLLPSTHPRAGAIVLFAVTPSHGGLDHGRHHLDHAGRTIGGEPSHAALLTAAETLIHAHWSQGVVESRFGSWFRSRLTHCFTWPYST
jgi:cell wall-associated NlpC family hydrolase